MRKVREEFRAAPKRPGPPGPPREVREPADSAEPAEPAPRSDASMADPAAAGGHPRLRWPGRAHARGMTSTPSNGRDMKLVAQAGDRLPVAARACTARHRRRSLAVLDIGVQDSGADGAWLAFDARLAETHRALTRSVPASRSPSRGRCAAPRTCTGAATSTRSPTRCGRCPRLTRRAGGRSGAGRLNETGPSVARAGIPPSSSIRRPSTRCGGGARADRQGRREHRGDQAPPAADAARLPGVQGAPHLRLGDAPGVAGRGPRTRTRHVAAGAAAPAKAQAGRRGRHPQAARR